jgi:hypothetical protein
MSVMNDPVSLTALERELLELCSMSGEPTTTLDEEMLEHSPGRAIVEAALQGLRARRLVTTERGIYAGMPSRPGGEQVYEDDWWDVTGKGRPAVDPPPRPSLSD